MSCSSWWTGQCPVLAGEQLWTRQCPVLAGEQQWKRQCPVLTEVIQKLKPSSQSWSHPRARVVDNLGLVPKEQHRPP